MAPRATTAKAAKAASKVSPEGASGTAREAPSADSGDGVIEAPSGTKSAPPSLIPTDQQPEHSASVGTAKPEAEPADTIDGTVTQATTSGVASGLSAPETGEATGSGAPAGAVPDAGRRIAAGDGVIKTAIPAAADGAPRELVAPFDPAAFVSGLSVAEKLTLAVWVRNAVPLVFDPTLNAVADLTAGRLVLSAGDDTRSFRALSGVKRGGRHYRPGDELVLTRQEHAALKSAGAVAEDWPD